MNCRDVEKYLQAYVDGEFSEAEESEIEQHFKFCPVCRKNISFETWFKKGLKQSMPDRNAPQSLRVQINRLLKDEKRKEFPLYLKLTPAVAIVLIFMGVIFFPDIEVSSPIVEATVDRHVNDLPFDVQSDDYQKINKFFREKIGQVIRIPSFRTSNIVIRGGRLGLVRKRSVAYLSFNRGERRYSMTAAPFKDFMDKFPGGRRRVVNNHDFFVTKHAGFNVVVWRNQQMIYSIVSDEGERDLVELAAAAEYDLN